MTQVQLIERLATPEGRLPGSEQDRRATAMIAAELESMGRRVEVEEIRVRPAWHLTFAMLLDETTPRSRRPVAVALLLAHPPG